MALLMFSCCFPVVVVVVVVVVVAMTQTTKTSGGGCGRCGSCGGGRCGRLLFFLFMWGFRTVFRRNFAGRGIVRLSGRVTISLFCSVPINNATTTNCNCRNCPFSYFIFLSITSFAKLHHHTATRMPSCMLHDSLHAFMHDSLYLDSSAIAACTSAYTS